jgi:hypothetical protein
MEKRAGDVVRGAPPLDRPPITRYSSLTLIIPCPLVLCLLLSCPSSKCNTLQCSALQTPVLNHQQPPAGMSPLPL